MKRSNFLNIDWNDLGRALLMLFITTFIGGIIDGVSNGAFPTVAAMLLAAKAGGVAALGYLLKQIISNSKGELGAEVK